MPVIRKEHREQGASAAEFALILPILLLLLFGIIEFGIIFFNKAVITNASREGARFGIKVRDSRYTETEIEEVINHYCFGPGGSNKRLITWGSGVSSLSPDDIDVVWSNSAPAQTYEDTITVTVSFKYSPLFLGILFPEINLQETTYMKMEGLN